MDDQFEQACEKQIQDWKQGNEYPVETYLRDQEQLKSDPEAIVDLIYNEILLKQATHRTINIEDYYQRFPNLMEPLQRQWELHQIIVNESSRDLFSSEVRTTEQQTLGGEDGTVDITLPSIPGYKIAEQLGQGASGVVYRAWQDSLSREVALKVIQVSRRNRSVSPLKTEQAISRFREEASLIANLKGGHVIPIHDYGEHEDVVYFSMDLAEEGTLAQKLKQDGPLSPENAAGLIEAIARSLATVHDQGIIHRDLKPANILQSKSKLMLADFGLAMHLAQAIEDGPTRIAGTPAYMAPEQTRGDDSKLGPSTDIYALGVILYESLTGKPPFQAHDQKDLFELVRSAPVPSIRRQRKEVSRQLESICLKCLEKDPEHRYQQAEELANDLHRVQEGKPILELEKSWARKALMLPKLHPWMTACCLFLVACLSGYLIARPYIDPDRDLNEVTDKLGRNEPVIIDASSPLPGPFRALLGSKDVLSSDDNKTFSVRTTRLSLVQLVPDPRSDNYRLTLDVRHDGGVGISQVGLFFGYHQEASNPDDPRPLRGKFYTLTFAERGSLVGRPQGANGTILGITRFKAWFFEQKESGELSTPKRPMSKNVLFPISPLAHLPKWRQLILEVCNGEVKGYWKDESGRLELVGSYTAKQLSSNLKRLTLVNRRFKQVPTSFSIRSPIGLFVNRGEASFRLVKLEPLSETEK